jgi:carboxypeptidase C (cathepsin A)
MQLIIAGESYGGHYLPAWAAAIMNYNKVHTGNQINFAGIAIGKNTTTFHYRTT